MRRGTKPASFVGIDSWKYAKILKLESGQEDALLPPWKLICKSWDLNGKTCSATRQENPCTSFLGKETVSWFGLPQVRRCSILCIHRKWIWCHLPNTVNARDYECQRSRNQMDNTGDSHQGNGGRGVRIGRGDALQRSSIHRGLIALLLFNTAIVDEMYWRIVKR